MMAYAIHSNVRNLGLFLIYDKVGISKLLFKRIFFVEYDTLDRIYKFEDKQMQTGMTLGHKCFVTQFSTKEVLYYDDFLKNY
jgi:hypothetical protein